MSATPWLSILVPVYNVAPWLAECLRSVQSQIDKEVEVIALDDASTDDSAAVLAAAAGPHTIVLRHARNQGLSAARNTMIEHARGDYLWFLDSDDRLEPGAVAGLRTIVRAHAPDLVLCDYRRLRERTRLKHRLRGELHVSVFDGPSRTRIDEPERFIAGVFARGQMHAWTKITRRALWGDDLRFPVGRTHEDMSVTPRLLLRARSAWYQPDVWLAYRHRAGSILTTMTVAKAAQLATALVEPRRELGTRPIGEAATFYWSHLAARNFCSACRLALAADATAARAALPGFRAAAIESMPLAPAALLHAYLWRGWWLRAARLAHWLRRSAQNP